MVMFNSAIELAYLEERWQDLLDLLDELDLRSSPLHLKNQAAQLRREAQKQKHHPPIPRVGVARGMFVIGGRGVCLPVKLHIGTNNPIPAKADFRDSIYNAAQAVQAILGFQGPLSESILSLEPLLADTPQSTSWRQQYRLCLSGTSAGLTIAILIISNFFKKEIPANAAFSSQICSNGKLIPACKLKTKIDAINRNQSYIKRIFIAESSRVKDQAGNLVRCDTLEEVIRELFGEDFFEKEILPNQENIDSLLAAFKYYTRLRDHPKAGSLLNEILHRLKPAETPSARTRYAFALAYKGLELTHKGQSQDAKKYFQEADQEVTRLKQNLDPSIPIYDVYNTRGVWLTDHYQFKQAEQSFNKALRFIKKHRYPDYKAIPVWNSLGQLYAKTGRYSQAKQYLQEALQLARKSREYRYISRIYCYLAENSMQNHKFEEAQTYLQNARNNNSLDQPVQDFFNDYWQICLFYLCKTPAPFLDFFTGMIEKYPTPVSNHPFPLHLGMICAYAAEMARRTGDDSNCLIWKQQALPQIKRPGEYFLQVRLLKIDASLLADELSPIFFSPAERQHLIHQLARESLYFKNLQKKLGDPAHFTPEQWRTLDKHIVL